MNKIALPKPPASPGAYESTRLPKLCGADLELGNFITGISGGGDTGYEASRALLREIHGVADQARSGASTEAGVGHGSAPRPHYTVASEHAREPDLDSQDWG